MPEIDDDPTALRLAEELAQARTQLARLEREYDDVLHDADTIQEDRDATRQLLEEARSVAAAAHRAVERHRAGTYGRCVRCGAAITPERLEALPDVDTCIDCQGRTR